MTIKQAGYDTITSLGSNNVMTLNGSAVEQISQSNFLASFGGLPSTTGANATQTATSGTGETDLHTLTIPANTLQALGDWVSWTGGIKSIGGAVSDTNTARLYINGTAVCTLTMSSLTSAITVNAAFDLFIGWSNTNTVTYVADFAGNRSAGTIYNACSVDTQAVTLSSNFDIKITGQCGQADGAITCYYSILNKGS
jgi:hypothetical protein